MDEKLNIFHIRIFDKYLIFRKKKILLIFLLEIIFSTSDKNDHIKFKECDIGLSSLQLAIDM